MDSRTDSRNRWPRRLFGSSLVAVAAVLVAAMAASPAQAATGNILRTVTAANPQSCSLNLGVAFDGTDLYMSCESGSSIDVVKPSDGSLVRQVAIGSGIGAIAFDGTRSKLWVCRNSNDIELADPVTGASTPAFTSGGCRDGLAFDGSDNTLWASADASCQVRHYSTTGTLLSTSDVCSPTPLLGSNGNSGIAVGGPSLYLANNGGSQVYEVDKAFTSSSLFFEASQRLEDLECDNLSLAPKNVMWIQDAYDRNIVSVEIPEGRCGFGGVAPTKETAPGGLAPATPSSCVRRAISLVRADVRGRKVVLSGLVAPQLAGRPVTILANYAANAGRLNKLTTVTSNSAGQFTATIKRPSRKRFISARYRAQVNQFRSFPVKLPQSLSSKSAKPVGGQIEVRGKVKRSLLGKRNTVVIKRLVCGRYRKVGQAKPDRNGNYVVRFTVPQNVSVALFRAESFVLNKPHGRRYVKQYARAISITLTNQTG